MCVKKNDYLFLIAIFIFSSASVYAEMQCRFDTDQGIGALGRIEPRSRVIKVSHKAGPEGARFAHRFFQESLEQSAMASVSLADAKRLAFEQSEANIKRLSAEIANAQSELKVTEAELDNTLIYAPISGTVLKILAWPGERIGDQGLLHMADLTQLDVVAEVYESDLSQVRIGQAGCIDAIGFKQSYRAQVRELGFLVRKNDLNDTDPLADRDNRIIEVRLTLETSAVNDLQHQIFRQVRVRISP